MIAKVAAIGNPRTACMPAHVRRTGGAVADVSDEQIIDRSACSAATEGIFAETAGGVTLGVLRSFSPKGGSTPGRRR